MKAFFANLVGLGAAGGALALGLVLGAPEASAGGPAKPLELARPDGDQEDSAEVSLGESMELWGRPSRLSMFWTADDVGEVTSTYTEAWKGVGEPLVRTIDRVTSVSVLEKETGLMRSVTITDMGDQRLVVPSMTDVRAFPDLTQRHAPVPVPENAMAYLSQVADDAHAVTYHATYLAPMSPTTAVEFYKVELGKLGYQGHEAMAKSTVHAQTAQFVRGQEMVDVVATPTTDGSKEATFVVVEHTRAIQQEE